MSKKLGWEEWVDIGVADEMAYKEFLKELPREPCTYKIRLVDSNKYPVHIQHPTGKD